MASLLEIITEERHCPGCQGVNDDSKTPNICCLSGCPGCDEFRRGIWRSAIQSCETLIKREGPTESEIHDFYVVVSVEEYVLEFEISVGDLANIVEIVNDRHELKEVITNLSLDQLTSLGDKIEKISAGSVFLDDRKVFNFCCSKEEFYTEGMIHGLKEGSFMDETGGIDRSFLGLTIEDCDCDSDGSDCMTGSINNCRPAGSDDFVANVSCGSGLHLWRNDREVQCEFERA
jgi:hypothetical protein